MATTFVQLNEALAGRYRVERELGRGGMAAVYLAHDLRHERLRGHPRFEALLAAMRFP